MAANPEGFSGYLCSLSSSTIVYKGLIACEKLQDYYPDLRDERVQSHVALVHARFVSKRDETRSSDLTF